MSCLQKKDGKRLGITSAFPCSLRACSTQAGTPVRREAAFQTPRAIAACLFLRFGTRVAVVTALVILPILLTSAQQPSATSLLRSSAETQFYAFIGVTVVPMDTRRILTDQVVLVRHGRVLKVGPVRSVPVPPEAKPIEAHGLFLMPGLADMHVHLMEPEAYFPLFLANGVTTVRNMAGGPEIIALRERVNQGTLVGPTIYTAGPLLDGEPPVWPGSDVITTQDEAHLTVKKQRAAGYDFLKVYDNLHSDAYEAIIAAAARMHMPVAGHVPPHVGLERVLAAHQHSIEHLTGYLEWLQNDRSPFQHINDRVTFSHPAHLQANRQELVNWVDESRIPEIAQATARAGTWNVPTLVGWRKMTPHSELDSAWNRPGTQYATPMLREWWNSDNGYSLEVWADKRRGDTLRLKLTKALHDAGARLLIGTEAPHPFVVPGLSTHEELSNFVEAGLSPYEALRASTVDAAEFLGVPGDFGVIKPGARADLILAEANPLENVKNASRIVGVMVRGLWLPKEALQRRLDAALASAKK